MKYVTNGLDTIATCNHRQSIESGGRQSIKFV